jgi:sortase A
MPTATTADRGGRLSGSMARIRHVLSIALITAGVFVVADAGLTLAYKEPLSSIYGSIKQGEASDELKKIEASYPSPEDREAVEPVHDERERIEILARRFAERTKPGEPIGRIVAPAMDDLDMVVVQGTDEAELEKGPGHYPETPFPGQGGTVGIAGHRTTYLAPFRHIDSMEEGDRIYLEMPYAKFTYEVQKTSIVDPSDVGVVRYRGYERLVLSACHPLYSAEYRFIVYARMIREKITDRA